MGDISYLNLYEVLRMCAEGCLGVRREEGAGEEGRCGPPDAGKRGYTCKGRQTKKEARQLRSF